MNRYARACIVCGQLTTECELDYSFRDSLLPTPSNYHTTLNEKAADAPVQPTRYLKASQSRTIVRTVICYISDSSPVKILKSIDPFE
ncbi:hypothetical protein TNCV_3382801 [Trichonephila clavipes]|nr:hypothetical protein TNCV_3382801 [Trichonephila clavipes]